VFSLFLLVLLLSSCNSKTKEEFLREGKSAVAAGNFQGAVVLFRAALEKDPNDFQVRAELADSYMRLGRYAQAEQELQKVKMQAPSYAELPLKMGELHVRMRQYAKAAEAMGPYLKAHSQSSRGYEILGQAEIGEGDLHRGEDDLRTALKLDEKNRSARLVLAQLLINNGQGEEGRQLLIGATAIAPHWKEPYFLLGRLALVQDKPDEALGFYQKVLADDPSDLNALYHEGLAYLGKGDSAQALALADKIVKKNPESSKGWQLRGLAHYRQKQGGQAIVDFQEALKHRDELASYYFLGLAYSSTSQYELALNQFQKVLDYRPKSLLPRIMVATTLLRQQRDSDAVQQALIAIQNDPKSALAHNVLGSAYMAQGHYEDAMKEFDLAIDLDPKLVTAHLKKGLYRMSQGKFDKAEEEIGQAVAIAPELLDTRLILANYYMRQKNYQAAAAALQEGLRGKPFCMIRWRVSRLPGMNRKMACRICAKPRRRIPLIFRPISTWLHTFLPKTLRSVPWKNIKASWTTIRKTSRLFFRVASSLN
jgi:putative PEP-CTERM system TPR-repeat lipoprotein